MGGFALVIVAIDLLMETHIVIPEGDRLGELSAFPIDKPKDHFRIEHDIAVLKAGMGNGD